MMILTYNRAVTGTVAEPESLCDNEKNILTISFLSNLSSEKDLSPKTAYACEQFNKQEIKMTHFR